jgi:hypothetical protein
MACSIETTFLKPTRFGCMAFVREYKQLLNSFSISPKWKKEWLLNSFYSQAC